MMSIDEAIEKLRCEAIEHSYNMQGYSKQNKEQIAEWLEELKAYKTCNEGKFIHYKESVAYDKGYAKGFNDGCAKFSVGQDYEAGYNKAIDDFMNSIEKDSSYAMPIEIIEVDRCRFIADKLKGGTYENN